MRLQFCKWSHIYLMIGSNNIDITAAAKVEIDEIVLFVQNLQSGQLWGVINNVIPTYNSSPRPLSFITHLSYPFFELQGHLKVQ